MGFLLETVEEPPAEDDEEDALPDAFINMILSFNQHFQGLRGGEGREREREIMCSDQLACSYCIVL